MSSSSLKFSGQGSKEKTSADLKIFLKNLIDSPLWAPTSNMIGLVLSIIE